MKAGPALARWLGDPAARAETAARNRSFAASVRSAPPLAGFARALDELPTGASDVAPAALDALRDLLGDERWIAALIASALAAASADPFLEPPFAGFGGGPRSGIVLLDHPLAIVTLSMMTPASLAHGKRTPGRRSIGFNGVRSITRFVKAGAARVAFYAAAEGGDDFRSETAPSCRRLCRRTIVDGEVVVQDGGRESFVIETLAAPLLMVAGELRGGAGLLAREYDAATLAFVGASAADEASSRIQLMLSLLRVSRRADAADLFARTIAAAPFFLRWQAMREFLGLDAAAALPALTEMAAGDPHPEVRAAAQRCLAVLRVRHPALFATPRRRLAA